MTYKHFDKTETSPVSMGFSMSISPLNRLQGGKECYIFFTAKRIRYVEIFIDEASKKLALSPVSEETKTTFCVSYGTGSRRYIIIPIKAVLKHIGLDGKEKAGLKCVWDSVSGMIEVPYA